MSRVFPKNSRAIAGRLVFGLGTLAAMVTTGIWYYGTPKYTRVGYQPVQPIAFSHQQHVGQLGLDCLYCHTNVAEAPHANIPAAQTCWNCHGQDKGNIRSDSPKLEPLRQAIKTGQPINWVRVHKAPDYVYFNHAAHVKRGVGCVSCHGQINEMPVVTEAQPLSMSWCLDCHRNPDPNLRPASQVTNMKWDPAKDPALHGKTQLQFAKEMRETSAINPPTNCTGCHR